MTKFKIGDLVVCSGRFFTRRDSYKYGIVLTRDCQFCGGGCNIGSTEAKEYTCVYWQNGEIDCMPRDYIVEATDDEV